MSKKTYYVEMPVTMVIKVFDVEADSKEDAIAKVKESNLYVDVIDEEEQFADIELEWEMHDQVVRGNVFYGLLNEASAEEEDH